MDNDQKLQSLLDMQRGNLDVFRSLTSQIQRLDSLVNRQQKALEDIVHYLQSKTPEQARRVEETRRDLEELNRLWNLGGDEPQPTN